MKTGHKPFPTIVRGVVSPHNFISPLSPLIGLTLIDVIGTTACFFPFMNEANTYSVDEYRLFRPAVEREEKRDMMMIQQRVAKDLK